MYVDRLESRTLLSSSLSAGILSIVGTDAADMVLVYKGTATTLIVSENGVQKSYAVSTVKKISADSKGGNDRIEISKSLTIPTSLAGNSGNDTITGGGGADTVVGGSGNDLLSDSIGGAVLRGGDNNDTLRGGTGVDALLGEAGDDVLDGGTGSDYLDGGAGYDTADYSARSAPISASLSFGLLDAQGNNTAVYEKGKFFTTGYGGEISTRENDRLAFIDSLVSGSGNDVLSLNKLLVSRPVNGSTPTKLPAVIIDGRGGADRITISVEPGTQLNAEAIAYGGEGNDRATVYSGAATFYGGAGADLADDADDDAVLNFIGGTGIDTQVFKRTESVTIPDDLEVVEILNTIGTIDVIGNAGNNTIRTFGGTYNLIDGGAGDDEIFVPSINDKADPANPTIYNILGGAGKDYISSVASNINAGSGNDYVNFLPAYVPAGSYAQRNVFLGSGDDTVYGIDPAANDGDVPSVKLYGEAGNDTIVGGSGKETIYGGSGNDALGTYSATNADPGDVFYGGDGNDSIDGGSGKDVIFGEAGADALSGRGNDDYIDGGADNDVLTGGTGRDRLFGSTGDDTFYSFDSEVDTLDGGSGIDKAQRDNSSSVKDSVLNIESFI